jgi:hypothetical protein
MNIRYLLSDPRHSLFGQLTVYYVLLATAFYLLIHYVPTVSHYLYEWRAEGYERPGVIDQIVGDNTFRAMQAETALALLTATVGALLLMVPVTWVYMGTRRRRGLDQSMVESLLILPIAVAGVVVIVQDSLALAFSLAGIFAGIQFRSKLKYYADAHFLFASIGVGLAAGIGALHIASVMSVVFNYTAYLIWRLNYGADAGERHLRFASDGVRHNVHRRKLERHQHERRADETHHAPEQGGGDDAGPGTRPHGPDEPP